MLSYEFQVNDKVYNLRLTTRYMIKLEEKVGCNPLLIFGKGDTMPTVSTMVAVLWASLQPLNHNITEKEAQDIFDRWLDDGHSVTDFVPIIIEIYKVSGLIKDDEKN